MRTVERGPTGSVFPIVFLLSTKPVYAPRPVYCGVVGDTVRILSHSAWPFTDRTGAVSGDAMTPGCTGCGVSLPARR